MQLVLQVYKLQQVNSLTLNIHQTIHKSQWYKTINKYKYATCCSTKIPSIISKTASSTGTMALPFSTTCTPLTFTTKPLLHVPAELAQSPTFRTKGHERRHHNLMMRIRPVKAVLGANEARSSMVQKAGKRKLADCWREMMGTDDWAGLLDPMDPLLRNEVIKYGEMAQACYDAFDYDPYSKYSGSCKFKASEFFDELDMAQAGYKITRYLYATSNVNLPNFFTKTRYPKLWSKYANWIGYV